MFGLTRGFSSFLIMFATRNMNVYFKKYYVSFLSCKQVSVLPLIQICLKILTRVYLLPEFAFCLMQCCLPKPWEAPGPSQAGRPTRAPHGTLVYIQTQIIIRNHFKKPWVRTCSRMLFEVFFFFFFFARAHFPDLFLKPSRPTAHHIFRLGVWNLGGQLVGGVTCVLFWGLVAPLLISSTEFFSDVFPCSFFL